MGLEGVVDCEWAISFAFSLVLFLVAAAFLASWRKRIARLQPSLIAQSLIVSVELDRVTPWAFLAASPPAFFLLRSSENTLLTVFPPFILHAPFCAHRLSIYLSNCSSTSGKYPRTPAHPLHVGLVVWFFHTLHDSFLHRTYQFWACRCLPLRNFIPHCSSATRNLHTGTTLHAHLLSAAASSTFSENALHCGCLVFPSTT